jgi:hypothetical protein
MRDSSPGLNIDIPGLRKDHAEGKKKVKVGLSLNVGNPRAKYVFGSETKA